MSKKLTLVEADDTLVGSYYTSGFIDILFKHHAFAGNGHIDQGVIEVIGAIEGTEGNCRDEIDKLVMELANKDTVPDARKKLRSSKPKAWRDLTNDQKRYLMVAAAGLSNARALTCLVSPERVSEIIATKRNVAKELRDSIRRRLDAVVGKGRYGIWLAVETSRWREDGIHIHGVIWLEDETHFYRTRVINKQIRHAIKSACGDVPTKHKKTQLCLKRIKNRGWINYCKKGVRAGRFVRPNSFTPTTLSRPYEAGMWSMTRIAEELYGRLRLISKAYLTGEIEKWPEWKWRAMCVPDPTYHAAKAA